MATITTHVCDLCRGKAVHKKCPVPVTFLTEQTEGRPVKPYLAIESLDLCEVCLELIVRRQPIQASGAMGHNTYEITVT